MTPEIAFGSGTAQHILYSDGRESVIPRYRPEDFTVSDLLSQGSMFATLRFQPDSYPQHIHRNIMKGVFGRLRGQEFLIFRNEEGELALRYLSNTKSRFSEIISVYGQNGYLHRASVSTKAGHDIQITVSDGTLTLTSGKQFESAREGDESNGVAWLAIDKNSMIGCTIAEGRIAVLFEEKPPLLNGKVDGYVIEAPSYFSDESRAALTAEGIGWTRIPELAHIGYKKIS